MVFAIFGKIAPKIQKRSPKCSQKCAKLAILASKLAILGTSWRQVGQLSAILAHLGAKPQEPSKWSPRCGPNRILGHLVAKRVAQDLKSAPGASIWTSKVPLEPQFFNDFSFNFGPNSMDFSSSFRELILQNEYEAQVRAASSGTVAA